MLIRLVSNPLTILSMVHVYLGVGRLMHLFDNNLLYERRILIWICAVIDKEERLGSVLCKAQQIASAGKALA